MIRVGVILIFLVFLPDLFSKKKKDTCVAPETNVESVVEENEKLKLELEKLRSELNDKKSE